MTDSPSNLDGPPSTWKSGNRLSYLQVRKGYRGGGTLTEYEMKEVGR